MSKGPVKIAEYADEILAVNAQQFLADNGVEAKVLTGGIVLQIPRYELYVSWNQAPVARELLAGFEAESTVDDENDVDRRWEGEKDGPTDCEDSVG